MGILMVLTEYMKWYCVAAFVLGIVAVVIFWKDKK